MRSCLEGAERENTELEREMMKEIESLQKALECRKKMLEQVVGRVLDDKNRGKGGNENEYSSDGYYEELIAFKARTKQLIAHYQQQI